MNASVRLPRVNLAVEPAPVFVLSIAGVGTIVSLMLPYVGLLFATWTALFVAWQVLGLPWGV